MPIVASDILFKQSGASNLGGAISASDVSASLHGLFDAVTGSESSSGDIEYRCIYVKNSHATLTLFNAVAFIQSNTPSASTSCDIGLGSAAIGAEEQTVVNENSAPAGVSFSAPSSYSSGLAIGDLAPGQHKAIWIQRTVDDQRFGVFRRWNDAGRAGRHRRMTPKTIIALARKIINDNDPDLVFRQEDSELVEYVNHGIKECSIIAPLLFRTVGDMECAPGETEQGISFADAQAFLEVIRIKGGRAVLPRRHAGAVPVQSGLGAGRGRPGGELVQVAGRTVALLPLSEGAGWARFSKSRISAIPPNTRSTRKSQNFRIHLPRRSPSTSFRPPRARTMSTSIPAALRRRINVSYQC